MATIAPELELEKIKADINNLRFENLIVTRGKFRVFIAAAKEIPNILMEIGRLREKTFREVGEGTGRTRDLDKYDQYYYQLFIWDTEGEKIVGGYRMGPGIEIVDRYGIDGFYVNSLFVIDEPLFPTLRQSVELGRSYIVAEYQKQRLPLFLLWKAILHYLLQNPEYRYLFGPLSISKYFSDLSRNVIVEFVKRFYYNVELAQHLHARTPFKFDHDPIELGSLLNIINGETKRLDNFIQFIEPAHLKTPVLLKQYIKLHARFMGFNLDPNFSDALDGFIILDLNDVPYKTIESLKRER